MVEFVMPYNEDDTISYDLWMTSSSDRALDFIEDFAKMDESLGDGVKFTPHYVFWECPDCDPDYIKDDCYGGGRYCAVEPSNMAIKGRDIVLEDLRQKCMWNDLSASGQEDKWWKYITKVHQTCYSVIGEDCSKRAHSKLGLNWDTTMQCVADSFTCAKKDWSKKSCYNNIIDEEISYWKEFGTNIYPSIVINKKTYRGQIEPLSVYNALCAAFKDPPQQCLKTLHKEPAGNTQAAIQEEIDAHSISGWEIFWLVFLIIIVNVVVVYCCRRRARRELTKEMNSQIESAVSQYIALAQPKDGDTRA